MGKGSTDISRMRRSLETTIGANHSLYSLFALREPPKTHVLALANIFSRIFALDPTHYYNRLFPNKNVSR